MDHQRMSKPFQAAAFAPQPASSVLQRKCGCGRHTHGNGQCSQCRKKQAATLQRAAVAAAPVNAVPPLVLEVLRAPGQPLDLASRRFFEPRFGHDFSRVRVHTDARAATSARAVGALSYTAGQHIVFDAGQYAPETSQGRRLLAHELTHVVQQGTASGVPRTVSQPSDPLERAAETAARAIVDGASDAAVSEEGTRSSPSEPKLCRILARRMMHCTPNTHGAPADPFTEITDRDRRAGQMTKQIAETLRLQAQVLSLPGAMIDRFDKVQDAYATRFGLPNVVRGGFLNRLTGKVAKTQELALSEEFKLLAARYRLLTRMFSQFIHYLCVDGPLTFAGCAHTDCTNTFAESCAGIGAIFLCPDFWTSTDLDPVQSDVQQASVLIHEGGHINWEPIGDDSVRGPGGTFRFADCYSSFVADVLGFRPLDNECPDTPFSSVFGPGDFPLGDPNRQLA